MHGVVDIKVRMVVSQVMVDKLPCTIYREWRIDNNEWTIQYNYDH